MTQNQFEKLLQKLLNLVRSNDQNVLDVQYKEPNETDKIQIDNDFVQNIKQIMQDTEDTTKSIDKDQIESEEKATNKKKKYAYHCKPTN